MGLAGPRNRAKISHDPRNTAWSNSTSRFGHRILTTLGWTPGSTLGDTTSLYHQSGHITAASQAGVKIVLKDDNLGIGCNKRAREDECVGLDGLQDLLGRLNGKDEETIGKEVESRERMRREVIVGERYGMRFVRGETYVSSDIEMLMKKIEGEKKDEEKEKEGEKKIKKEDDDDEDTTVPLDESSSAKVKKEKKEKKSKRDKSSTKSASATPAPGEEIDSKSSSKKRKRTGDDDAEKTIKDKNDDKKAPKMSKKSKNGETREERKARREREKREREARKVEKRKKRKSSSSDSSDSSDDEESTAPSGTVTPSIPAALVGRQAVRHRYIAAKRSAVMDAKALNEIFMIKA